MINRFEQIVTTEDVAHGKPAPDIFLKAAELAGVPPSHCIVFEDSPLGVQGGLAAGMAVVAIAFPGSDRSLFKGACQVGLKCWINGRSWKICLSSTRLYSDLRSMCVTRIKSFYLL